MTDEQIRISMAELEGWSAIENWNTMATSGVWKGFPPHCLVLNKKEQLPDYLQDLNAVHRVFEKIVKNRRIRIVVDCKQYSIHSDWLETTIRSDTLTRALYEFCLRAKNKWRDNE